MIGLNISCFCCCSSIVKSCMKLCNPKNCSIPGFSVHHCLLEFPQTYVQWISDAIKPAHCLFSLSPLALSISQHQGLFQCVSFSHPVAEVLELWLQHKYYLWIFRFDFLWNWLVWSPCCSRDSQESPAPQFKSINSLVLSLLYGLSLPPTHDYWISHSFDNPDLCQQSKLQDMMKDREVWHAAVHAVAKGWTWLSH